MYAVKTSGTVTALLPANAYSGATFNSLTVGPDNTSDNASGNYFFLYACDNANNNVIRVEFNTSDPSSPMGNPVLVTTAIPSPVCGRVGSNVEVASVTGTNYATTTTSGNLYVASGSDIYEIPNASSTSDFSSVSPIAVIASTASSLGGMTQKNSGDMLVVGPAGSVLLANYSGGASPFGTASSPGTLSPYITDANDLTAPVGIARAQAKEQSDSEQVINDFFVVNNGKGQDDAVYGFDPSSSTSSSFCSYAFQKGNVTPTSIAASEDNYLYVGVSSNSANSWGVQILTPGCQSFTGSFISLSALSSLKLSKTGPTAVAVPPVAEAPPYTSNPTLDPSSGATVTDYNFGSSLFRLAPASGCTISDVQQTPMPLTFLQGLVNDAQVPTSTSGGPTWYGGAPATGDGEGGFGTLYSFTASPSNCSAQQVQTTVLIGGFFDSTVTNPRIIHCVDDFSSCNLVETSGDWPVGGFLPNDAITMGGKTTVYGSKYFVVNGNLTPNTADQGFFCGFENPVIDTQNLAGPMSVFSIGQGVSVKFKLGADGSCSSGNFITNAYALLSIAQVRNGSGETVFVPIQISTQGSSTDNAPIFKFNSNSQNYQFSLNLTGYAPGIYEMAVTFLTNNAPAVYTYFKVQ